MGQRPARRNPPSRAALGASVNDDTERLNSALADRYRIERQLGQGDIAADRHMI